MGVLDPCVCKVPQPLRSHMQSFRTIYKTFEKIPPLPKKCKLQGKGGEVPEFCLRFKPNISVRYMLIQNFGALGQTLLGEK